MAPEEARRSPGIATHEMEYRRRSDRDGRSRDYEHHDQVRDGEVSLSAEIASDYLALRVAQPRIAVLRGESIRQRDSLTLVSARQQAGFVTQYDVDQQNMLLATTDAQIAPLQTQIAVLEHALAVLLATQLDDVAKELDAPAALPAIPTTIPVGLPSDLLRRRPDVREAERRLASATADIGVAVADLYPKLNLLGLGSFSGPQLSGLFTNGNLGEVGYGSKCRSWGHSRC